MIVKYRAIIEFDFYVNDLPDTWDKARLRDHFDHRADWLYEHFSKTPVGSSMIIGWPDCDGKIRAIDADPVEIVADPDKEIDWEKYY